MMSSLLRESFDVIGWTVHAEDRMNVVLVGMDRLALIYHQIAVHIRDKTFLDTDKLRQDVVDLRMAVDRSVAITSVELIADSNLVKDIHTGR